MTTNRSRGFPVQENGKSSGFSIRIFVTFVIRTLRQRWSLIVPALFLFAYVAYRAAVIAITWDEAHTFFEFVRHPSWLPSAGDYMAANNHLLNTWLMKCSVMLFGESELALRLPNVLAGGVYFVAAGLLAEKLFERRWMAFLAFLVLTLNPFVLDFFSTARGYGISLALLLCGCLQLMRYLQNGSHTRAAIVAQSFFAVAAFANLTLIHVLLAASGLLLVHRWLLHREFRSLFLLTLVPVLTLALLLPYISRLGAAGALFYGEEIDSAGDTFLSLSEFSLYGAHYSKTLVPVITVLLSAIPLAALILLLRNAPRMLRDARGRWAIFTTLLLILAVAGPVLQHWLLGTNYLSGRTALFYLPLLALAFLSLLLVFPAWLRLAGLGLFGIALLAHFAWTANTRILFDWREQADVKDAMLLLKKLDPPVAENCFANALSSDLPYEKQLNYYRMRFGMEKFGHAARKESIPACSYYYLPDSAMQKFGAVEVLGKFPATQTTLFRMKDPAQLVYVDEVWQDFEREDPFLELRADTLFLGDKGTFANNERPYSIRVAIDVPDTITAPLVATLNCRLNYESRNCCALLVFEFVSPGSSKWEAMHITELSTPPGEWSLTGWTRPVPAGTQKVKIYLWNPGRTEALMDNVALRLLAEVL